MASMFTNYDNMNNQLCEPLCNSEPQKDLKIITNIKGEILGVQIKHGNPLKLYFHLENLHEVELEALLQGFVSFEILTTTHKNVVSKEYPVVDILNLDTSDLHIALSITEMETLKKETYNMRVTLKVAEASYEVFAEKDGYLIIR